MEGRGTLFREIHKNTWLKRVIADNRKIPVGIKKPEKYWVVFCVHDDCEALLEGYTEPRQAPSHSPDWTVSLQTTLHISHTLVPSENEYEFVIALAGETLRFNASSWEIMQEWVDTLRLKLREMKILSPKENLYSKLPEVRPPLLPTRDPTRDPLPATPPVPAAIVPGVERIVNTTQTSRIPTLSLVASTSTTIPPLSGNALHGTAGSQQSIESTNSSNADATERISNRRNTSPVRNQSQHDNEQDGSSEDSFAVETTNTTSPPISSTSNTLSQNLIKMLYPLPNFSQQTNESVILPTNDLESHDSFVSDASNSDIVIETTVNEHTDEHVHSLARTFAANVLFDTNASSSSKRAQNTAANSTTVPSSALPSNRDVAEDSISIDSSVYGIYPTPEPIVIPRPQTTRGSAAKSKKLEQSESQTSDTSADVASTVAATTNITIIQVSSAQTETAEKPDLNYMNNVQIIPSNYTPNDQSAKIEINTSNCQQIKEHPIQTTSNKSILPTSIESHDDIQNARQFGAITNISIGANEKQTVQQQEQLHYEQVFITHTPSGASISTGNSTGNTDPNEIQPKINRIKVDSAHRLATDDSAEIRPSTSTSSAITFSVASTASMAVATTTDANISNSVSKSKDPAKNNHENDLLSSRRPVLSRGVTEAVIMRPSRKDVNMLLNRINPQGNHCSPSEFHTNSQHRDSAEQRKRSSSTSDTQRNRTRSNNNNVSSNGNAFINNNSVNNNSEFRRPAVQPNQPFRQNVDISLRASGRMTLREQQVMQLRREMCHPGGVRIQLRRKDCTNSIAFVDAFGAAWISGWKQKEHPMLYNALHIGDQIISIGGVTVTNAKEANKIINNSTGQFIEFIIRRVPFGRVYAIRREIDRQCLGLIRDGNTATIVDVVPNSLSARHGLPPKAQSCDGLSLTFWVLTEINGRPLNLFFKDNEVRDRLNSVGRDISILVQPSDLVSKLKKQLKSLRNHKDYIVQ